MSAKEQPKCLGKCSTCFYNQINACVAKTGDDLYLSFSISELDAIGKSAYHYSLQKTLKKMKSDVAAMQIA